ncbi:MAG: thioredoxin-dependent thiol peroxidase [Acidimicrobiales bacterium]
MTARPQPGDPAPELRLVDQQGREVDLGELRAGGPVFVYFYPKADTPGCTAQACGLRDALPGLAGAATVVGISPDPPSRQARFDGKYSLGFPLLSDPDHAVAEAYGVWVEKSMYGRKYMGIERSAFLVGEDGTLRDVWYKISPKETPERLVAALSTGR